MKLAEYHALASEHDIQRGILTELKLRATRGVFAIAIPNAGKRSGRMGRWMKAEGLLPGVADICVLLPEGRCLWMETKTAKGRQSPAQKEFERRVKLLGHVYVLTRSVEYAIGYLQSIGATK